MALARGAIQEIETMLRGTRTWYLQRQMHFTFVVMFLSLTLVFLGLILASAGWWRIVWLAVLPPIYILTLLLTISKLTDLQWYRHLAESERKANQLESVGLIYGDSVAKRAHAFAKRIFGGT